MLSNRQSFLNYAEISTKKNEPNKQTAYSTTSGKPSEAEESNSIKNEIIYSPKRVFKKARKNSSEYKINPDVIPRPSHFEEIYRNPINKSIIYETNEENLPPFTTAFYTVKETENSSPRLIRSSLVKIPLEQEYLNKSNLIFGLNVQPFAELLDDEKSIPIVEVKEDILRCSRCNCYINNKFELKYMINSKKVAICNCCNYIIDLNTNNNIVKSEYMASDLRGIPELSYPSIDFIAPEKFKSNQIFYPYYGIFIDVSPLSIEMGYASYVKTQIIIDKVLNSITSSLESFHNKENSSLFIATYDSSNIHFYLVDNNGDIKVLYIPDIDQPFAPVPKEKILLNISKNKEQIEKIVEKIQYFLTDQRQYFGKSIDGAAVGAAISAGKEVFRYGGGARVLVFCFSPCFSGFGCSKPVDSMNLFNTDNEKLLYIPQNDILTKISLDSVQNEKTVFDLFVIHNQSIDLVNLSQVCNITGGKCHFYTIDNPDDLKLKLEKLHYDLSRVFSRRNYYNVSLKLRSSQEIDIVEIIGPFGRRLGSALSLSGCDPEYSFNFYCKIKDNLKVSQRIHFQLAVIYTDNFNQRFLRILNYTIQGTPDISIMYKSIDVDVMTKLLFCKEISSIINTGFYKLRTELVNKLVTTLIYYRDTSSKGSSQSQLILPECLKYYPLYLNSLFKKPILNKNKTKLTMNCIVDEINSIRRDPVYLSIKYLYPKLYRIDDITEVKPEICQRLGYDKEKMLLNIGGILVETGAVQRPYLHALTIDRICFEGSYLIDTGRYIYLIIFKETNVNFISAVKLIQLNPQSLEDTNENELNIRLVYVLNQIRIDNNGVYQPLKILFIKDNYDTFNELTSNLIEDSYKGELSYIDFLCEIHSSIQCRKPN